MNRSSAKLLFMLTVYAYGLGQVGGYAVSVFVFKKSYLFAAIPFMNVSSWFGVAVCLSYFVFEDLRHNFQAPPRLGPFGRYYALWLPFALLSFPIGFLEEWPLLGVGADAVYQVLGILIYLVARVSLFSDPAPAQNDRDLLVQWTRASLVAATASITVFGLGITNGILGALFPSILIVTLFYMLTYGGPPLAILTLATPLVLNLPDSNRTTVIQMGVACSQFMIAGGAARLMRVMAPAAAIVALVAVVATGPFAEMLDLSDSPLGKRIAELADFNPDPHASKEIAVSQRFYEAEAVGAEYEHANVFNWLFGFGAGATFDMKDSRDDSVRGGSILGEDRVHNIHFHPVAIFFRHGGVGLAFLAYFVASAGATLWKMMGEARRTGRGTFELVAAVYVVQALVEGLAASSHFITNPVVPYLAAYLDHAWTTPRPADAPAARASQSAPPRVPLGAAS